MNRVILTLLCACLANFIWAADPIADIGSQGDAAWEKLIRTQKADNSYVELTDAAKVAVDFKAYQGKIMPFPKLDFSDFVTDSKSNKYFYYGAKGSYDLYVIKYDDRINDRLRQLANTLGNIKGDYEVLGKITDAYGWWGNVIEMEIVAMRVKGRVCVIMDKNGASLVGQDILDKYLASKQANWTAGIDGKLTKIPAKTEPEMVAKLFLYYGSKLKNQDVWIQTLSVDERAVSKDGDLEAKGKSWWRMVSMANREYYFVRPNTDRDSATTKYFMYQIKVDGADVGVPKPMSVIKEKSGEWRVDSF